MTITPKPGFWSCYPRSTKTASSNSLLLRSQQHKFRKCRGVLSFLGSSALMTFCLQSSPTTCGTLHQSPLMQAANHPTCATRLTTGRPCKNPAATGQTDCRFHLAWAKPKTDTKVNHQIVDLNWPWSAPMASPSNSRVGLCNELDGSACATASVLTVLLDYRCAYRNSEPTR